MTLQHCMRTPERQTVAIGLERGGGWELEDSFGNSVSPNACVYYISSLVAAAVGGRGG